MATQASIFKFTGRLGKVIGYQHGEKTCSRSMPEQVRQTSATRRAALRFGRASKTGAGIRHILTPLLDVQKDGTCANRLTRLLIPGAGMDIKSVKGFRFNKDKKLSRFFTEQPVWKDNQVHIPQAGKQVEVKIIAARMSGKVPPQVIMTKDDTTVPVFVPGKGALVIVLQVRCCKTNDIAAEIIAVKEEIRSLQPVMHGDVQSLLPAAPLLTVVFIKRE